MDNIKIIALGIFAIVLLSASIAGARFAIQYVEDEGYTEYEAHAQEPIYIDVPAPVDRVTEAKTQLESAKKLLDDEEAMLLADIADKEARLEEIREIRLSFSQAPDQVE